MGQECRLLLLGLRRRLLPVGASSAIVAPCALSHCQTPSFHAVRGGGGAAAAALRYPFVTFVEDASGELRAAMGPAAAEQAPESYLVDSIGTAVSCCVGASGHAEAAMEYAST